MRILKDCKPVLLKQCAATGQTNRIHRPAKDKGRLLREGVRPLAALPHRSLRKKSLRPAQTSRIRGKTQGPFTQRRRAATGGLAALALPKKSLRPAQTSRIRGKTQA